MKNGISPDAGENSEVILIGADGFIGSAVTDSLRKTGWTIIPTVFQRSPESGEISLDVTIPEDFNTLPRGIPVINVSGLPDQSASKALMRQVHIGGMKNLTAWASRTDCPHVIQISSVSVYGYATVGTGRTEAATRRRTSNPLLAPLPYGRTKARAEALLERSGLPWSALRLPAVFGPGDSFLTPQMRRLMKTPGRPLPPAGSKPVSIIPIACIGSLLDRLLQKGPLNRALNAAGAHIPWNELMGSYAEAWGYQPRRDKRHRLRNFIDFSNPGMQMVAYYSALGAEFPDDKLRKLLDWEPADIWRETIMAAARAEEE